MVLTQALEFLYGLEWGRRIEDLGGHLVDPLGRKVAEEPCCFRNVRNAFGY
jgi:hypothetical protein